MRTRGTGSPGVLANDLVAESRRSRSPRSPNTIFEIYHLVRSRLFEVGLYPKIEDFREAMEDPEYSVIFPYTDKARRLAEMENRIQGVTQRTVPAHFGEWLYRAKNPEITADGFFLDIKRIIKLTGPLNRPLRNKAAGMELTYILTLQRQIEGLRRMRVEKAEQHRDLIVGLEELIAEAERRLMRAKRAAAVDALEGDEDRE